MKKDKTTGLLFNPLNPQTSCRECGSHTIELISNNQWYCRECFLEWRDALKTR